MSQAQWLDLLVGGINDTLFMTIPSTILAYLVGMPLGILFVVTGKEHILPKPRLNTALGVIINFLRSIPFIILLAMLIPVTRLVMGSGIGTRSLIFPLFISAFPFVARMVEGSLKEVDYGVIEAAQSMGSSTAQIIFKVLVPEALPSLVNGAAICTVAILGYSAMASAVGGGGLGAIAITKGLNIRRMDIMYAASVLLVILVQIIAVIGNQSTKRIDHRKR